jgi:GGDEF domain-containing protein
MANRAEQIKFNINKYVTIPESNRTVTTSIGYSYNYTHANLAQVMKGADVALYKSKTDGKNQINRFEQFLPTIDEGPKLI